jgi:hypothetical protein
MENTADLDRDGEDGYRAAKKGENLQRALDLEPGGEIAGDMTVSGG